MQITRIVILLALAGLSLAATAQSTVVVKPPQLQTLPEVLDPEISAMLTRGEFESVRDICESKVKSSALVTEPGVLANPYLCLGEAFYGLNDYESAALAFTSAIDQLEVSAGAFDRRLVRPLEGLGKSLMQLGQLEAAQDAFIEAKDLTHRNFGIYNLLQSSIVNRLTKSYYKRGELEDASREQNFLFRAHEETYGEAPQLLPALRRLAKWHERTGRYDLARNDYRRALQIMLRAYGPDDLRLVGPLQDFAGSYLNTPRGANRVMSRAGSKALMEVIELYQRQEFTDAVDLARSWGELGDWYVIGGRRGAAREAYSQAGKVLQSLSTDANTDIDLFSRPVEIEYEDVPIGLRSSRLQSIPDGIAELEFEFTVTAEGRVTNLVVLRDDLNYTRFALEVGQRIKASRYRPRVVDGKPVATQGVRKTLRYDFARRIPAQPDEGSADAGTTQEGDTGTGSDSRADDGEGEVSGSDDSGNEAGAETTGSEESTTPSK